MKFTFNISDILNQFGLEKREKDNLISLFEFTNYLYDSEENLTKTFNLKKEAKEKLIEKIEEMFEYELQDVDHSDDQENEEGEG
ncbi:MAG: hypothetical protein BAJALOKI1v1_250016 [Promethearchaeota archaeon]|nr:MAG: hypothetical protein BAJALOKI1v1_250016 [Candidatus Lokiarchaeota archaeon]